MRQSEQCFYELSSKEGAYCALGCVAEAYRRAHPNSCNWVTPIANLINFELNGNRNRAKLPIEVTRWAIGKANEPYIDNVPMSILNDSKTYTLNEFADILEGKI